LGSKPGLVDTTQGLAKRHAPESDVSDGRAHHHPVAR
jgi:hypothetical protein